MDQTTNNSSEGKLLQRLQNDPGFRYRILTWIFLCWSFVVLGWLMAQLGPALLDLQEITRSTLEEASLFVTTTFIGYLIGSIINGLIFDKMNKSIILLIGLFFLGSTAAVIPFSTNYELMLLLHFIRGLGAGVLDSGGNALLLLTFRNEKSTRVYMQIVHFMFAVGGILSPMATAPFLLQETNSKKGNSSIQFDIAKIFMTEAYVSTTQRMVLLENNSIIKYCDLESKLYIPYLTSAGLCVLSAFPFLYLLLFKSQSAAKRQIELRDTNLFAKRLPSKLKITVLVVVSIFIAVDNGSEDTYFSFFSTFTVKFFKWTKKEGSYAASVYWAAYAFGRCSAIFIAPHLKPSSFLKININGLLVASLGMLFSAIFEFDSGVWIFSPIFGFSISTFFPSIFLVTEEDLIPVTGRVASLLMFSASLGSMVSPIITGFLMDNLTSLCFVYVILCQCLILLIMTWTLPCLCKKVSKYKSVTLHVKEKGELLVYTPTVALPEINTQED